MNKCDKGTWRVTIAWMFGTKPWTQNMTRWQSDPLWTPWTLPHPPPPPARIDICPASHTRWCSVVLMLGQLCRRWTNNKSTTDEHLVFVDCHHETLTKCCHNVPASQLWHNVFFFWLGQRHSPWTNIKIGLGQRFVIAEQSSQLCRALELQWITITFTPRITTCGLKCIFRHISANVCTPTLIDFDKIFYWYRGLL